MKNPLLLLLCFLLLSCGGEQENTNEKTDDAVQQTAQISQSDSDSLRTVFLELHEKRKDWFPSKFVFEAGKLNPVDEALRDTTFFIFREELLEAVRQKDAFKLLEITDGNIKYSFGEDGGLPGFVQLWELDSPEGIERSPIWETLEDVLMKGGSFSEGGKTFSAPYYYGLFPEEYDAFTYGLIVGKGVRMRSAPNLRAPVVKSLSYDIVEIMGKTASFETIGGEEHPWVQLKLLDGREGYVWGKYIGSPIGFRAGFSRQKNGSWLMHFFVAGD